MRIVLRLHQGNGGNQGDRRLANPERMQAQPVMLLAQGLANGDHVIDVIVKVEPAGGKGKRRESTQSVM